MALKAKIRGKVRKVSPALARALRRRGVSVIDTDAPPPKPPKPTTKPKATQDLPVVQRPPAFDTSDAQAMTDDELEKLTAPES